MPDCASLQKAHFVKSVLYSVSIKADFSRGHRMGAERRNVKSAALMSMSAPRTTSTRSRSSGCLKPRRTGVMVFEITFCSS